MNRKHLAAAAATLALVAAGATTAPATAVVADAPSSKTIVKNLLSPLSLAVSDDGTVYYSQNFAGQLFSKSPGKKPVQHFQGKKGEEVGAVSEHHGSVRFATTGKKKLLWGIGGSGKPVKMADLGAYEAEKNPDAGAHYGFETITPGCAQQLPTGPEAPPAQYTGIVDSHPYGSAIDGSTTYVADAGANAILAVKGNGKIKTVALIPGVPVVITQEIATAIGFPNCTVGLTYVLEGVPTDVEKGSDGKLYVSTLTGGPEDGSTGALSKVYKINPKTGAVKLLADNLFSATGVAVADNGDVYVSQLFPGTISRIKKGKSVAKPYYSSKLTAAVEWTEDGLYATTNALTGLEPGSSPRGKVVWIG
ncbi:ScyD/ScyE family protein [Nocardioides bigeumensis]|uniref:ScyD/ScyE family protein n=1 Tax=Nocardioides bigeumensis TaxID=433657 RepID=A0ABP5KAW6_9ACTN